MSRIAEQLAPQLFGGTTYHPKRDSARLSHQLSAVKKLMLDFQPHTLAEASEITGVPLSTIGSRIRDLRKPQFGRFDVRKHHLGKGLYSYRMYPKGSL